MENTHNASENGKEQPAPVYANGLQYLTTQDPALQRAWRIFIALDESSVVHKSSHIRIRRWIIVLSFAATVIAVSSAFMAGPRTFVGILIRTTLVALPIILAALMTYASQFSPALNWIMYRTAAEKVRQQIYLYRMQAGTYGSDEKSIPERQADLVLTVREIVKDVNNLNMLSPFLRKYRSFSANRIWKYTDVRKLSVNENGEVLDDHSDYDASAMHHIELVDDGFSELSSFAYVNLRVIPQRDWYVERINKDYGYLRNSKIATLVIAGMGSLLASIGLSPWVAVTTAGGVAIATYIQLKMYGQTYNSYHVTATRIDEELARWRLLSVVQQEDPSYITEFVENMEVIFEEERQTWKQQAIQIQAAGEETLAKTVDFKLVKSPISHVQTTRANNASEDVDDLLLRQRDEDEPVNGRHNSDYVSDSDSADTDAMPRFIESH